MKIQYIYILLLAVLFAILPIHAIAGNCQENSNDFIYIENINVEAGETFDIPVKFRNEATYSAFQCDIKLPQGVEFVTDEYGEYCITPESSRLTNTHTITISQTENGDMRLACYSSASRDIKGNDGALLYIKAKAGEECRGELGLRMSNIRFSTADAKEKILEDVECIINVENIQGGGEEETTNDFMYIENINVEAGGTFDIPVKFRNEATYSAFQCDMTLPEGVEIVTDEYGEYCITPESSRLTNTHTVTISPYGSRAMRVACYSSASRDIRGNDGALFYIKAKAGEECRGELGLRMSNIRFSTADAKEKILEDVECIINVENIQGGGEEETTNDFMYIENINVEAGETFDIPVKFRNEATYSAFQCDMTLPEGVEIVTDEYGEYCITPEISRLTPTHTITISQTENGDMRLACYSSASRDIRGNDGALFYIKAKAGEECRGELGLRMSNIRFSTADAKEKILEDVECIINVENIQGGGEEETTNDFMYIENINVEAGGTFDIPVKFRNETIYSAFQCDMTLPEGVEIVTDEYGEYCITPESSRLTPTHTVTISQTENGDMRLACYSSASRDIRGNDGALLYIKAKAGEECRGELGLRMSNIRFSTADAKEKILEDVECIINVENIQGGEEETTNDFIYIENINVEAGETFDIPVKFRNEATYSAFQCDMTLPEGVEIVTDEYGEYCITPEISRLTPTHTITISQTENGDMRLACYSSASRDIKGNDGALLYIKAKAGEECLGELGLRMSNIRFSTADAKEKILEDVEGTITIIPPVKYYTITYMVDGEVYATDTIAYGAKIEPMPEPTKEGHTFSGWSDIPETMPANDVTVKGTFNVNYYTITYMVDGEVYATDSIRYGEAIKPMQEPTKEGHTFSGWSDIPETMPANDVTVKGTFNVNHYTITYMVDGEVYATDTVAYGAKIEPMPEPTKEGHTFSGWSDIPETMPANDVTVKGTFNVNHYTVTFVVDGEVYQSISVEFGAEIELPAAPEKEGYTFTGWIDVPATMPAEDIVIEGRFEINTGIGITNFDLEKDEIYNLNGLRIINTEDITRGIYIINGKKVLVK